MGLRESIGKPAVGGPIAAIMIVLAIVVGVVMSGDDDADRDWHEQIWYYDLNTDQIYADKPGQIVPIAAPSGALSKDVGPLKAGEPAGAEAHVFSCGACKEGEQFVGFIVTYTKEGREAVDKGADFSKQSMEGHIIRAGDGEEWLNYHTDEGRGIMRQAKMKCAGKKAQRCYPATR